jgi:hypothetical protein
MGRDDREREIRKSLDVITFSPKPNMKDYNGWGWKEPNSHLFIKELSDYFSNMKYIHVIRNGFDIAYSNNQNQAKYWGAIFNIELLNSPEDSFRYWFLANQRVISLGKMLLKNRFLVMKYEDICNFPIGATIELLEFLGLLISYKELKDISSIPKPSSTIGRYKNYDNSWINKRHIKMLNQMGYEYA